MSCATPKKVIPASIKAECRTALLNNYKFIEDVKERCGKSLMCIKEQVHVYMEVCTANKLNKKP